MLPTPILLTPEGQAYTFVSLPPTFDFLAAHDQSCTLFPRLDWVLALGCMEILSAVHVPISLFSFVFGLPIVFFFLFLFLYFFFSFSIFFFFFSFFIVLFHFLSFFYI